MGGIIPVQLAGSKYCLQFEYGFFAIYKKDTVFSPVLVYESGKTVTGIGDICGYSKISDLEL